jgi:hypothetical protein
MRAADGKSGSAVPRLGRSRSIVDACFGTACKFLQATIVKVAQRISKSAGNLNVGAADVLGLAFSLLRTPPTVQIGCQDRRKPALLRSFLQPRPIHSDLTIRLLHLRGGAGDDVSRLRNHGADLVPVVAHDEAQDHRRKRRSWNDDLSLSGAIPIDAIRPGGRSPFLWRQHAVENDVVHLSQMAPPVELSHGDPTERKGDWGIDKEAFDGECILASKGAVRAGSVVELAYRRVSRLRQSRSA